MSEQCGAKRYSDQMMCGKCGLQWDINDLDPPHCSPTVYEPKQEKSTGRMMFIGAVRRLKIKNRKKSKNNI